MVDDQFQPCSQHQNSYKTWHGRSAEVRSTVSAPGSDFAENYLPELSLSNSTQHTARVSGSVDTVPMPASGQSTTQPTTQSKSDSKDAEDRHIDNMSETSFLKGHRSQHPPFNTLQEIFCYQLVKNGLVFPVYGKRRTIEDTHEALMLKLVSHCAMDSFIAIKYCSNASNGLHVFLDMSNIDVSFHTALRAKYKLAEDARLTPLPRLNLQFLSEVLVRGRRTRCLSVGCSTAPKRTEPKYVQELRELGYRVDLRERRRVEDGGFSNARRRSSPTRDGPATNVRYVEELVDETLQTRIAEAVMEYFQEQGTIVLATGDAKPAQYSDGFFIYVDRALRMGWNVEVVSWHASLSSAWTNTAWSAQWRDRFRIIELDDLLDDLLVSYA